MALNLRESFDAHVYRQNNNRVFAFPILTALCGIKSNQAVLTSTRTKTKMIPNRELKRTKMIRRMNMIENEIDAISLIYFRTK